MSSAPIRLARIAARLATGTTYAKLGFDAAYDPGPRVGMAAPMLAALRRVIPLPDDELIVRANGAVQAAAGAAMIVGLARRPSAAVLVGSLIPTTIAGHAFWSVDDPAARKMQQVQFQKNMAMLGGLLFAIADCEG
ncbi:DoxX family membrane protein [Gordonia sp. TBRC 11910]|uniref:DoxX family membrane protein n=1 Tax=Gordonia asplenii TaxID=2725283 RepID=A0A848L3M2_9ACTN|nr:DoxX family membrane protein [Gordonia asplenii]NMO03655.1 DoxX family membrane protein [Gordonia asplenii]